MGCHLIVKNDFFALSVVWIYTTHYLILWSHKWNYFIDKITKNSELNWAT